MATGYDGGKGKSTANQELLALQAISRKYYEFDFMNKQDCTVIVNNSNPIPCPANVGFTADGTDARIEKFSIVEADIDYIWRGKY